MSYALTAQDFAEWRDQARTLITLGVPPADVAWTGGVQSPLFGDACLPSPKSVEKLAAPAEYVHLARVVSCHRDPQRWDLLYQLLWRLLHGENKLLRILTDPLMHAVYLMEKAVRRDVHKTKAFVRFRLVQENDGDHYIAWHRPDHRILPLAAPFFARRFTTMKWTILTPDQSVHWDGEILHYGPGVPASEAPADDFMENLWRDYYRAIFNPARIKIKAMKREMPVRHWATLPETQIIADMLAEAPERVEKMMSYTEGSLISAQDFIPARADLADLREAAKSCQGCELHQMASQTVFGEGLARARLMIVGEQPGDQEDIEGRPFIGPAGLLLDEALERAGIDRNNVYITNAVKHFRFVQQGNFRRHNTPLRQHIHACKPWLDAEISVVKPAVILCLGNTAARSLIAPGFSMKEDRGKWTGDSPRFSATWHPAAILRNRGEIQGEIREDFFNDIREAAQFLKIAA